MGATCLAFAGGFILWRCTARPGPKALGTVALLVGVAAIALSGLILGVRYPTDVLGSLLARHGVDEWPDRRPLRHRALARSRHRRRTVAMGSVVVTASRPGNYR